MPCNGNSIINSENAVRENAGYVTIFVMSKNENELRILIRIYMKTLFYTISILTIIIWALSYFVYFLNGSVHFLLLTSALLGIAGVLEKKWKPDDQPK